MSFKARLKHINCDGGTTALALEPSTPRIESGAEYFSYNLYATQATARRVREGVKGWKAQGLKVGLVPTMGYLHEGHESLIKKAVSENDRVVVSVFVNPTQFGPNEDLDKYPRDLERDSKLCENAGASLILHPESEDMYYKDASTFVEVGGLTTGLCGSSRPTHFRGVCTVVSKLFNIIPAHRMLSN